MADEALDEALELARSHPVFVATADASGLPHLACAGRLEAGAPGQVRVTEWLCPGTVENVARNRHVSVVVWNEEADTGYQLLGRVEELEEIGVLDGYSPELEPEAEVPQVQRQLTVRVDRVLDFSRAPHTDREEP